MKCEGWSLTSFVAVDAILAGMDGHAHLSATLELDRTADQLRGRLTVPGQETREFVGWLGLATAIEWLMQPEGSERSREPQDD